jgi:hypothetical protein
VNPHVFGFLALVAFWVASFAVTRRIEPWALATGHKGEVSASQLQAFIFTAVTVFSYVTVASGRLANETGTPSLPEIPVNLLILMGISVTTAAGSKGITLSYLSQGRLDPQDNSSLTAGRDGQTDLTKVQMLVWTVIGAAIYLVQVNRYIAGGDYLVAGNAALPDVDGALLVLMGVAQGGYLGGKLVSRTDGPMVEKVVQTQDAAQKSTAIKVYGISFGDSRGAGDTVWLRDPKGGEREVGVTAWGDNFITGDVPSLLQSGKWTLQVRSAGRTSQESAFEVR